MERFWVVLAASVCGFYFSINTSRAAEELIAKSIQDNSCIVEEAYNQEPGVVQHILCAQRQNRDWSLTFTQEWPVASQTHQFSYTIPYSWLRSDGQQLQGVGDVMLNYRLQALTESDHLPALAPRLSVILPIGNPDKALGYGSWGYQMLLPISKIVSERVTLHANVGATQYFDVNGRQPKTYLVGGSAIFAVTRAFNLMLETTHEWAESVTHNGDIERERRFTLSPGFAMRSIFPMMGDLLSWFSAWAPQSVSAVV